MNPNKTKIRFASSIICGIPNSRKRVAPFLTSCSKKEIRRKYADPEFQPAIIRETVGGSSTASQIAARDLYAQAATAMGKDPRQNVYTRLGVKTVINCRGTWTYLSGSLEFPEVRQAQVEAAQHFVNMLDLQRAVGRRLSE